ncbi:proline rich transmembrane protein 1B-like [Dysidea avara]|uniref:proline rich transmembrane protein 1B-like n=1 Tax=Dysidea avara TaxID=196820 RepID=UPI0033322B9A
MSNFTYTEISPPPYNPQFSTYQPVPQYGTANQLPYPTVSEPQGTHTNITVVQQPVCSTIIVANRRPENYLVFSIINFLFCCICFGLAALIYSLQVDSHYTAGRVAQAWAASNAAKKLNISGFIIGTFFTVIATITIVVVVVINANEDDDYDYNYDY